MRCDLEYRDPQADPGVPWGPTPCPKDFLKIMQFSGNFKGRTLILSKFWAQGPSLESKLYWATPDQNPGSASDNTETTVGSEEFAFR